MLELLISLATWIFSGTILDRGRSEWHRVSDYDFAAFARSRLKLSVPQAMKCSSLWCWHIPAVGPPPNQRKPGETASTSREQFEGARCQTGCHPINAWSRREPCPKAKCGPLASRIDASTKRPLAPVTHQPGAAECAPDKCSRTFRKTSKRGANPAPFSIPHKAGVRTAPIGPE